MSKMSFSFGVNTTRLSSLKSFCSRIAFTTLDLLHAPSIPVTVVGVTSVVNTKHLCINRLTASYNYIFRFPTA